MTPRRVASGCDRSAGVVVRAPAELVIVGAGAQALTIAAELVVDGLVEPQELVVLDPSGRWFDRWERHFARLRITHLRSPVVHHPHPDVDAILRRPDLASGDVTEGPVPIPSQRIVMAVVRDLVASLGLDRCVRATTATAIRRGDDGSTVVECADGAVFDAQRVVIATNAAVPEVVDGLEPAQVPRIPVMRPQDHVAVVGGGLTAVQLVRCAVAAGARATLIARRPLVERAFDVDPGWMGPKFLTDFTRIDDPEDRLARALDARGGGTVPGPDLQWLRTAADSGVVELREGAAAVAASCAGGSTQVVLADGSSVWCDHAVAAVGSRVDVRADPVLGPLMELGGWPTLRGFPLLDGALRLPGSEIHLVGRVATIELGPAAGNLSGARRAARRIAAQMAGVDPVLADPGVSNQPVVPCRSGPGAAPASRSWS